VKKITIVFVLALLVAALLTACQPETIIETVVVEKEKEVIVTQEVEKEVIVTQEVEVEKEVIVEVVQAYQRTHSENRDLQLAALAQIPGVYVPSLYDVAYNSDGTIANAMAEQVPAGEGAHQRTMTMRVPTLYWWKLVLTGAASQDSLMAMYG